jgi:ribonuclease Z
MIYTCGAGRYTLKGASLGGIHTAIMVPELRVLFDVGHFSRAFVGADHIFLSHGHADHIGAMGSLLGARGLHQKSMPKVYMPASVEKPLVDALTALASLQRYDLAIECVPMQPGDAVPISNDLWVRAFRTFHSVPSLGYQIFRRVRKLKADFRHLEGDEIRRLRAEGVELFDWAEQREIAYATDTLPRVLTAEPSILSSRVLILECTFLDERKSREDARVGGHIHLDDLLENLPVFENEHLVLMHFSQLYGPREIKDILKKKLPRELAARVVPFVPPGRRWPL